MKILEALGGIGVTFRQGSCHELFINELYTPERKKKCQGRFMFYSKVYAFRNGSISFKDWAWFVLGRLIILGREINDKLRNPNAVGNLRGNVLMSCPLCVCSHYGFQSKTFSATRSFHYLHCTIFVFGSPANFHKKHDIFNCSLIEKLI